MYDQGRLLFIVFVTNWSVKEIDKLAQQFPKGRMKEEYSERRDNINERNYMSGVVGGLR